MLDKCLSLGEIAFFPLFPSHVYSFDVSRCLMTADMNCFFPLVFVFWYVTTFLSLLLSESFIVHLRERFGFACVVR